MRKPPQWVLEYLIREAVRVARDGMRYATHEDDVRAVRSAVFSLYLAAWGLGGCSQEWPDPVAWTDAMVRSLQGPWDGMAVAS